MSKTAVEEIKTALSAQLGETVQNGEFNTGSGGAGIDMMGAASLLVLKTPWTDRLPRDGVDSTGLSAQWYEILTGSGKANNTTGTAGEGNRGGLIGYSGTLQSAKYKNIVIDSSVTDDARFVTKGIIDPLAMNMQAALIEAKRSHHMQNLFGRGELGFAAAAATPTVTQTAGGGSIAAAAQSVIVVALNGGAYRRVAGYAINGSWTATGTSGAELADTTRTNGDGTTTLVVGGTGIKSAAGSVSTTGGSSSMTVAWAPTPGACGYAIFAGAAGSEVFQGATQACTAILTLLKTGSYAAASRFTTDNSKDSLEYDGLITLLQDANSPAFQNVLQASASTLSSSSDFVIDQFDSAFAYFFSTFDGYSPDYVLVGGKTKRAINKALLSNSSSSRAVVMMSRGDSMSDLDLDNARIKVRNPYTDDELEVIVDPYMPEGKVVFGTFKIPSQFGGNQTTAMFFRPQLEFYGETWSRRSFRWETSVKLRGTLCSPWRAGHAVIDNVAF